MTSAESHEDFVEELEAVNGSLWKEAVTEVHGPYNEIPVWILLYEDSSLDEVHAKFKSIAERYFPRFSHYQITVAYNLIKGNKLLTLDFLTSNEEILRGWSVSPPLGSDVSSSDEMFELFNSVDSRR